MVLSARRADLTAISEIAIEGEYGFVTQWSFPGSGALILDIGANMGCFSALVFSTCPDAEVHSVEPSPDTFALLSENRARYPALRWHTHQSAIGAETGTSQFLNDGPSTARKLSPSTASGVLVETRTFDSFVTGVANGRRIFLCKVDIEGAEVPIFSGAMNTLAQIDHFIVEVHGPAANAALVTDRLSATFPHVEAIQGRGSAKPMIHAWRAGPLEKSSS
jgi:FkbM family methyltransferase